MIYRVKQCHDVEVKKQDRNGIGTALGIYARQRFYPGGIAVIIFTSLLGIVDGERVLGLYLQPTLCYFPAVQGVCSG